MRKTKVSDCFREKWVERLTGRVSQSLSLHDPLHVGRPAKLASDENTRRLGDTVGNDNLLDLVTKVLLDGGTETLVLGSLLLPLGLLLGSLLKLETLLGNTDELLAVKLLELGNGVLVNGVDEEKDLKALLLENLKER